MEWTNLTRWLASAGLVATSIGMVGCADSLSNAEQSETCEEARAHVDRCFPDRDADIPESCDEQRAERLLSKSCDDLEADSADAKADGACDPWFSWTCNDDSDDSDRPAGDVCGSDARTGDFESTGDSSVDALAVGDGRAYVAIDDWNGTISDDDDKAIVCAHEIERRARLDRGDCFEPKQVEDTSGVRPIDAMDYERGNLYVAIEDSLFVYDVSDLDAPTLVGEWSGDSLTARDMEVRDGLVYLGGGGYIFDASDPGDIRMLADLDPFLDDWSVADGIAYAARGTDGVTTFDVSDPENPRRLDTFTFERSGDDGPTSTRPDRGVADFRDVAYEDGYLYVAADEKSVNDDRNGLWVFDVSDPSDIREVHRSRGAPLTGIALAARDGYVFLSKQVSTGYGESENVISVFDVSDPATPARVDELDPSGIATDIAFSGGDAVYASFDWGTTFSTDRDGVGTIRSACR